MRKNKLTGVLGLSVALGLTACSPASTKAPAENTTAAETTAATEAAGVEATYEQIVKGHNGDIKLSVTMDGASIKEVKVLEHEETTGLGDMAMDKILPQIVEHQTVNVDTVAGATVTSKALLTGVTEALKAAGANVDDFSKAIEKTAAAETINKEVDVVVVGAGGAGLSAAVEASKAGSSVLVLEKMPKVGGNTSICSGNIYATGSKAQDDLGLTDYGTVQELADFYMAQGDGHVDPEWCQLVAEKSGPNLDWLVSDIGVAVKHKMEGASHRSVISETSGDGIVQALLKRAEEQGTEVMLETAATELIVEDGKVAGVKADNNGNEVIVKAKSVILATGGYDGSDEAKAKYAPGSVGHHTFSNPGNVGDAIEMVKAVDGKVVLKGGLSGIHIIGDQLNSPISPLRFVNNGISVTDLGYRYVNESFTSAFDYYNPMVRTGRKVFYNISDATGPVDVFELAIAEGVAYKADTIAELAQLTGIPEYTLTTTIEEYNAACEKGVDEAFGKDAKDLKPIVEAPFYAVEVTPNTNGSFGGVVTNLDSEVLNNSGEVVENLYAAGAVANGDLFYLRYPVSGSSVSMCLTFGRIAGQQAAENAK